MNTETIEYKGLRIAIHTDDSPENPFTTWGSEPPLLTYSGTRYGSAEAYNGAPEDRADVANLLPDSAWEKSERLKFYHAHLADKYTLLELADYLREQGDIRSAYLEMLRDAYGNKPDGWSSASAWMDKAAEILNAHGIPAVSTRVNGYGQGDSTLCLAVATPEWAQLFGAPADSLTAQLEGVCELYAWWAYGDVYGYSVETGDGEPVDSISGCWGFYGPDHAKSGLLEDAQAEIDAYLAEQEKGAAEIEAALCSAE